MAIDDDGGDDDDGGRSDIDHADAMGGGGEVGRGYTFEGGTGIIIIINCYGHYLSPSVVPRVVRYSMRCDVGTL